MPISQTGHQYSAHTKKESTTDGYRWIGNKDDLQMRSKEMLLAP